MSWLLVDMDTPKEGSDYPVFALTVASFARRCGAVISSGSDVCGPEVEL